MVQSITLRGGAIDRFAGEALLATFGGMVDLKGPCTLALEAAREMRVRLELLNTTWKARQRAQLDNSISLHVGEVVLAYLGSAWRRDFSLVGAPAATASKVGALPPEPHHPIRLTGAFFEHLPPSMKALCRPLAAAQLPGHRAPLELYGVPEGPYAPPIQPPVEAAPVRDTPVTCE
jgi:class 3 adenylate cyclase